MGHPGIHKTSDAWLEHDCFAHIFETSSLHFDLSQHPLEGGIHVYVDGSCSKPNDNSTLCGYAVCSFPNIVHEVHSISFKPAPATELSFMHKW